MVNKWGESADGDVERKAQKQENHVLQGMCHEQNWGPRPNLGVENRKHTGQVNESWRVSLGRFLESVVWDEVERGGVL